MHYCRHLIFQKWEKIGEKKLILRKCILILLLYRYDGTFLTSHTTNFSMRDMLFMGNINGIETEMKGP